MKRLFKGTSFAVMLCCAFFVNAQAPCASDEITARLAQTNANYAYHLEHDHTETLQAINAQPRGAGNRAIVTIPIVFHVVYNSAGENVPTSAIYAQLETLNNDFRRRNMDTTNPRALFAGVGADVEIEFCLAKRAPGNISTVGITRTFTNKPDWDYGTETDDMKSYGSGGIDAWDTDKYLNVWIVDLAPSSAPGGGQTAGYAYLGNSGVHGQWYDGIVLDYSIGFGGGDRSLTHEVGHYLGLRHTWGNSQSCNSDDGFSDTPYSDGPKYGCDLSSASCSSTDMIENYMDYSNCSNMYTVQQANYMNSVLLQNRTSLLSSDGCTAAPNPGFYTQFTNICTGSTVQFVDTTFNDPATWSWTFTGGIPSTSTSQNPVVTYAIPGTYPVILTTTNAYGSNTENKNAYITVGTGGTSVVFEEDFENGQTGWLTLNPDNSTTWQQYPVSGISGSTAIGIDLFNYTASGSRDQILSPVIDLSGVTQAKLDFEYAYRQYNVGNEDSLIVKVSIDGGNSYPYVVWAKGGSTLATSGTINGRFQPAENVDWCTYVNSCANINLSAFDGESNVKIQFEAYNGYGNNIYFDNVLVYGNCTGAVVVNQPPLASFIQSQSVGCGETTITFTDQSAFLPTSWQWTFPGGIPPQSAAQNPTVTYYGAGTFDVSLTAVNANGNNAVTITNAVTINNAISVAVGNVTDACYFSNNGSASVTASGGVPAYTYNWSNGATTETISNLDGGTYTVTVSDASGCETTQQVDVDFLATLDLQFSSRADRSGGVGTPNGEATVYVVAGSGQAPYTYTWNDPLNQSTETAVDLAAGTYTAEVTDANGCKNSITITIIAFDDGTTGVQDFEDASISVYPNPANTEVSVEFNAETAQDITMSVYNVLGKQVYEHKAGLVNNLNKNIVVSNWPTGMYIVQIRSADKTFIQKLLID